MDTDNDLYLICLGLTEQGFPCRVRPRNGADYCVNHDPVYRDQQAENRALGNRRSAEVRAARASAFAAVPVDLTDRAGIQAALDTVMRLNFTGRITEGRSRLLLKAISLAVHNFDQLPGNGFAHHKDDRYKAAREALLASLEAASEEADDRDAARHDLAQPPADPENGRVLPAFESVLRSLGAPKR